VLVLGTLALLFWLLFRPYSRAAESVSGPRKLAFGKLRNLMTLLLLMYLIVSLTSRQGLGLIGTFSGVYIGGYMDVLGHVGFAGILLRSEAAVRDLATQRSSLVSYFRPPPEDAPAADPGAD